MVMISDSVSQYDVNNKTLKTPHVKLDEHKFRTERFKHLTMYSGKMIC